MYARSVRCFRILKKDTKSRARVGELTTAHGVLATPAFLPIGTQATVKALSTSEVKELGATIILANTYHLWRQPGDETIFKLGGLHRFMNWSGPIFTDSGGFQVFSLGERSFGGAQRMPFNVKISETGVSFQAGENGDLLSLTPEKSVQIQMNLGSDIALILDQSSKVYQLSQLLNF